MEELSTAPKNKIETGHATYTHAAQKHTFTHIKVFKCIHLRICTHVHNHKHYLIHTHTKSAKYKEKHSK